MIYLVTSENESGTIIEAVPPYQHQIDTGDSTTISARPFTEWVPTFKAGPYAVSRYYLITGTRSLLYRLGEIMPGGHIQPSSILCDVDQWEAL